MVRVLLGPAWLDLLSVFHWLLLAGFTALYARTIGLTRLSAAFAGLAVMASGHFQAYFAVNTVFQAEVWFPLVLAGIEQASKIGKRGKGILWIAVGVAAVGFCGHLWPHNIWRRWNWIIRTHSAGIRAIDLEACVWSFFRYCGGGTYFGA